MQLTKLARPASALRSLVLVSIFIPALASPGRADSVNSPNITMNVDANRSTGPGAGNVSVAVNTITIAETTLPEYASGSGKAITIGVQTGYQFDSASNVTVQSATIGFNGGAVNAVATVVPTGAAGEILTFNVTSGTDAGVQDIIRINGIRLKILSAAGAAGPAQTTLFINTNDAGGAFTGQGIVAANITRGAADHLFFSIQPGNNQAGDDLLPSVAMADFGGNIVNTDIRDIMLALQVNPGMTSLIGTAVRPTSNGIARWIDPDNLNLTVAASGYVLRASHSGAAFLSSDTVDSEAFDIAAAAVGDLEITQQPADVEAGGDILLTVLVKDQFTNPVAGVSVTVDSAVNPGGWPLLVDTSLTKTSDMSGHLSWDAADHLRINKATAGYRLSVSGNGVPAMTNAFNITPAASDHVEFTEQPVDTTAGEDIFATAAVKDRFGNINPTTPVAITLSLGANPVSASLDSASGLTKTTSNGLASWGAADDLNIKLATNGFKLSASGIGASATSNAFDILAAGVDHLEFTSQPGNTAAGADILVLVTTRDVFNNIAPVNGEAVTLSLSANPGGATLTAGTSLSKNTLNGIVQWAAADDLHITVAAEDYKLAAATASVSIESSAFNIAGGAPSAVRFVQQPTNALVNAAINPPVSVEVIDAFGNRTSSSTTVTLGLQTAPCGGAISGTSAAAIAGLATFDAVSLSAVCDGDVLSAGSSGLASDVSSTFSVTAAPPGNSACGATCGPGLGATLVPMLVMSHVMRRRRRGRYARHRRIPL